MAGNATRTGLYVASYEVTTGLIGAPTLHLRLVLHAHERAVAGIGTVVPAAPSFAPDVATALSGSFSYLVPRPSSPACVVVTATGAAFGARLEMLLDETWASGVASFRWREGERRAEIANGTVALATPASVADIAPAEIDLTTPAARGKASSNPLGQLAQQVR